MVGIKGNGMVKERVCQYIDKTVLTIICGSNSVFPNVQNFISVSSMKMEEDFLHKYSLLEQINNESNLDIKWEKIEMVEDGIKDIIPGIENMFDNDMFDDIKYSYYLTLNDMFKNPNTYCTISASDEIVS